jgi:hypothetical protein
MKSKFALFALAVLGLATVASAQSIAAGDASAVLPVEAQNIILNLLLSLAQSHPWIATVITVIGSARIWAKPAFSLVHWVIDLTPGTNDNAMLDRLVAWFHSPVGSKVAYLLDWVLSIKIIPPAAPSAK